jgi:hypothetical protein
MHNSISSASLPKIQFVQMNYKCFYGFVVTLELVILSKFQL